MSAPRPLALRSGLALLLLALLAAAAHAQAPSDVVYDPTSVSRVDVAIDPDSLEWVFDHPLSDREVPADFAFTRGGLVETVPNVGFRLRGNTSRTARKNSFKVSFNTFVAGRAWRGLEKLNLNGEHNDPTVSRSVLAWGLFGETGVVASRASHTELYVNGQYYGLYANVEHLDETWLSRRFGTQAGALFKCLYPADLAYRGPTGASYQHVDGSGRPVYELSQGEPAAYDALARFVAVLTQTPAATFPAEIERILDVNAFLKVLAADVAFGAWDNYWFNQNNYYLRFAPGTDRATYVPYDYDNTFGIDFVDRDWGTRNPYTWGSNDASQERPLVRRILAVPEFRARYTFYLRRLLAETFTPAALNARIDALEGLITPSAEADSFRTLDYGYTVQDFHDAFEQAVGGHVEYGLKPYVATRRSTLLPLLDDTDVPPIVHLPAVAPAAPRPADALVFTALVEDELAPASVVLVTSVGGGPAAEAPMRDDGAEGDAAAGDGVFTATLAALGAEGAVAYQTRATDATGQTRTSAVQTVAVEAGGAGLVVNEVLASNATGITDEAGDHADWVEVHNPTSTAVALLGYTLTDSPATPAEWAFPDVTLAPGGYLVVWADDEPAEGPLHTTFGLSAGGDFVGLFDAAGVLVDGHTFGAQTADVSLGRSPDATGPFIGFGEPTPGAANPTQVAAEAPPEALAVRAFPNPFRGVLTVESGRPLPEGATAAVFDALGRLVARLPVAAGATRVAWDASGVPAGVYVVRLQAAERVWTMRAVRL